MERTEAVGGKKSLARRIYEFPLVAMLIALAVTILCFTAGLLLSQYVVPDVAGFTKNMKFDLVSIPIVLVAYWLIIARLGAHPHNDYQDPAWARRLGLGLAAGVIVFTVAVAAAAALGVYHITGKGDLAGLLPSIVGAAIFPAISEELVFRGILFRWLEEFGGSWLALALTSVFFGASHLANPNATWVAAVGIALEAGVMLGAAYMLTRSLWFPMGIHAAWNFTQGEIFDIPVSGTNAHGLVQAQLSGPPLLTGNGFGLEASLTAIVVATLFGFWLLAVAIKRGELMQPMWVRKRGIALATV